MKIGKHEIGSGHPTFIIAELGVNHNGEIDTALEMVRAVARTGSHAVKIQAYTSEEFVGPNETYSYPVQTPFWFLPWVKEQATRTEKQIDMFKRCELDLYSVQLIRDECRKLGLAFIATATDQKWIDTLIVLGVDALKVGSDDIVHWPLLEAMAKTGKPVILSTGMASEAEIWNAVAICPPVALLHCVSLYPTPLELSNLNRMRWLAALGCQVGFSDHTDGIIAASIAIGMGASVIEKHFTLDRNMDGPDHRFSATEEDLENIVNISRASYIARGTGDIEPSSSELSMRKVARRSIVASRDIPTGTVITKDMLEYKRPGDGLAPYYTEEVVGKVTNGPIKAGMFIMREDLIYRPSIAGKN